MLTRLKSYATTHRKRNKKQKRASILDVFQTTQTPVADAESEPVATVNVASETQHLPLAHVRVVEAAEPLEDYQTYYKAKSVDEIVSREQFISSDGSINFWPLRSWPGGDFNPNDFAWYWTPQRKCAERYKEFAEIRQQWSEIWIIMIQISRGFAQSLKKEELWFSRDWKVYIWYCKDQSSVSILRRLIFRRKTILFMKTKN